MSLNVGQLIPNMYQPFPSRNIFWLESLYFSELGAHAKFWNPTTTPSWILGEEETGLPILLSEASHVSTK